MKNKLMCIVVLLVILGGGLYFHSISRRSATVPAPVLTSDLYPLYPGTTWGKAAHVVLRGGEGDQVFSVPKVNVTDLAQEFTPFTSYYEDKLTKAGWTHDMMQEASGPGSNVSVYTKGDDFAVVSYHSDFLTIHPGAPSECPCTIQFSLSNGTNK